MADCTTLVLIFFVVTAFEGRLYADRFEGQARIPVGGSNPHCFDTITNCADYISHDSTICHPDSHFHPWVTTHCLSSCNVCQGGPTTTEPPCVDQLDYCHSFDIPKACLDFPKWAAEKCRLTCSVCSGGPTTIPPLCIDKLSTCGSFDIPKACHDYPKWAEENCRQTCNVCTVLVPPTISQAGSNPIVGRK